MAAPEFHILHVKDASDIAATFPAMQELRPHLVRETYVATVERMMQQGYRLVAASAEIVHSVAGFRVLESLAFGKFMYVDDLVTLEGSRSRGAGRALMVELRGIARAEGCGQLHLDSGVQRHAAHRFYLRERMDITCFHFREVL